MTLAISTALSLVETMREWAAFSDGGTSRALSVETIMRELPVAYNHLLWRSTDTEHRETSRQNLQNSHASNSKRLFSHTNKTLTCPPQTGPCCMRGFSVLRVPQNLIRALGEHSGIPSGLARQARAGKFPGRLVLQRRVWSGLVVVFSPCSDFGPRVLQ